MFVHLEEHTTDRIVSVPSLHASVSHAPQEAELSPSLQVRRRTPIRPQRDLFRAHDIAALERRVTALAARAVRVQCLGWVSGRPLHALSYGATRPSLRVMVTAGVHGIEPAGPAAVIVFLENLLRRGLPHREIEITAIPLVNPVGYWQRTRGNFDGIDLNRSFADGAHVPREVRLVRSILRAQHYDLGIDLHSSRSSGRRGYFALHRDALDLLAPAMEKFGERHAILAESTKRYALEAKGVLRSCNRGTVKDYLADRGVRWSVTIEAPAALPYQAQVYGTVDIVETLVETALALRAAAAPGATAAISQPF